MGAAQTEKQRIIWAYKILFLDVLFPLSLRKVIFADSDQISRADFAELWNLDMQACPQTCNAYVAALLGAPSVVASHVKHVVAHVVLADSHGSSCGIWTCRRVLRLAVLALQLCYSDCVMAAPKHVVSRRQTAWLESIGAERWAPRECFAELLRLDCCDFMSNVDAVCQGAPYGYTPFCNSNRDMDGFRFWKQGFWKEHLQGKPYHISALYVVDLARFRCRTTPSLVMAQSVLVCCRDRCVCLSRRRDKITFLLVLSHALITCGRASCLCCAPPQAGGRVRSVARLHYTASSAATRAA